ncbi:MAG: cytochrome b/b6 domain-containing protein [Cellvibrionales bacterium]|jgi:cytochrome b|nr:cytochrome b/b6 domain-containing protein [Cellvibrionales bacterium]
MSPQKILVWDIPTRLFHWLLAGSFAVAYLTAEAEGWENVHYTAGFTLLGLIAFRLVWGLVGSRYARFSEFCYGPSAVLAYIKSLRSNPRHFIGHNPLGSMAVLLLLGLGIATASSGWLMYLSGSDWLEEPHELFANAMLALVVLHIAGVIISGKLHKENLSRAMVTGLKEGSAEQGIHKTYTPLGILLLTAVIGFWIYASAYPFDSEQQEGEKHNGEHAGEKHDAGDHD